MAKQTAHIDDWSEENLYLGGTCLVGRVTKHARQDEFYSDRQATSRLISIDREKGLAETQNTIYTLGKEINNG